MDGILFSNDNKKILFDIKDYAFDYTNKMDYYDANWLTVSIMYFDGDIKQNYIDNCLLTYELDDLIHMLDDIITGKETGMISDFMEPYLKFSVTKIGDIYGVQIRFIHDTKNWKEIYISQGMDKNELITMRDRLDELHKRFPIREGKN